ncbi:MAG: SDR family oxidoreductase [Bdellovibrionota bacterium]
MQRNVLLTGSTGILGSRTLIELLQDKNTHVFCPVRCTSGANPIKRILNAISIYSPGFDDSFADRIHPFICDLSSDCIVSGLEQLIDPSKINKVIHSSALTSFMSSHKELSHANQNVTLKMVDLVNKFSIEETIFVSSYSIFGRLLFSKGDISSQDLDLGQDFASLRYAESKFKTELLLRERINKNLKTAIVRPGNLHPDSTTGFHPALSTRGDDFFFDMLNFFFDADTVPLGNFRYDVTPVDKVAKAIASYSPKSSCETVHLVTPTPPSLDEIYAIVKRYRPELKGLPAREFFQNSSMQQNKKHRPLRLLALWAKEFNIYFEESAKFESYFDKEKWPTNEEIIGLYYGSWKKKQDERNLNYEVVGMGR